MPTAQDMLSRLIARAVTERERDRFLRLALALPPSLVAAGVWALRKIAILKRTGNARLPDTLFFFITNTCNQSCAHCFYASDLNSPTNSLNLEDIGKLCRGLRGGVPTVFLCGGEPTTRLDLPEIVRLFIDTAGVNRLFITTNGLLEERLLAAVDTALASPRRFQLRIPISLDGPAGIHDTIRRSPGGFRRAVATLEKLLQRSRHDSRLVPLVTTVLQRDNADAFVDFYKYLRATFDCQVQYTFVRQDSRDAGGLRRGLLLDAGSQEDLLPPKKVCRQILDEICLFEMEKQASCLPLLSASFLEHHLAIVEERAPIASPCIAPDSFATIFPDGGVSLCEVVRPFSRLQNFNYNLADCWNSPAAKAQRKELSSCWCTYPCALVNSIMRHPKTMSASMVSVRRRLAVRGLKRPN